MRSRLLNYTSTFTEKLRINFMICPEMLKWFEDKSVKESLSERDIDK